ncbi:MAG: pentapeptide repeat-containing protein [Desulfobaccales bacterium]|nr:pentapeptide repeat-containing protein [Desulfobaccales bacterium]
MGERLEALKQGWREVWPFLLWVLAALAVAGGIWALIYVPKMQVPLCPPDQTGLPPKVCFDIENEARKTLAYILGGILAIIGITLAHRRIRALERQVLVAQEGQITERFTRAIEQLGSDKMEVRLGGIYALERIANDSDKDYRPIMETLTAYVRENAPCREQSQDGGEEDSGEKQTVAERPAFPWQEPKTKPATDIQAVLTILGRRKYSYGKGETANLDLRNTDLRGAKLTDINLKEAILDEAHLEEATLAKADMEKAFLNGTHLKKALIIASNLEEASLSEAHLEGAILASTKLEGAILYKAHLEGLNLQNATGLTWEQLAQAIIDEKTQLPIYLLERRPEDSGPEGSSKD